MATFILIVTIEIVASVSTALLFRRFRKDWSDRRISIVAPTAIPLMILIFSAWALIGAHTASVEECGVDACGMVAAAGLVGLSVAVCAYLIGVVVAELVLKLRKRSRE